MLQTARCHCGKVAVEVDAEFDTAMECNCSICRRRGSLLGFVPFSASRLLGDELDRSVYTFNKHRIQHCFCSTCGCAPYALGSDDKGNMMVAVNLRCLDDFDPAELEIKQFDGASL